MTDSAEYAGNIGLITKTGDESIPLIGVFAEAAIIGKSSKVKITQKYRNNGKNAVEAVYKFPLPGNASVTGFRILLKDKIIKGAIEERDNAFKVYDDAMIKGNGAVLLDQERPNIFTLSVGNLNPGSEAGIEIEYISVPDFRNNNLRFFLPTTISPRYIPAATPDEEGIPVVNKVHPEYAGAVSYGLSLKVNVLKTEGIDINSISSPSHKVRTGFNESCYTVEFTSETVSMDRDFVLEIGYGKATLNRAVYFNAGPESFMQIDFNPDLGKYMQESSIGSDSSKAVAPDSEVIFVLDCSGSMEGSSIAQAKKSLEILIKALSPRQMFNIYRFGSSFDKFSLRGEQFDEMSLNAAMDFLAKTDASFGGTEILTPLKDIFSNAISNTASGRISAKSFKNIVLITDGEVGNEAEVVSLVHSNRNSFRVFTVGIGFGPNEYFIKEMAQSTGADYIMVHPEERIDLKVISMFKKLNMGAVEDIKIDFGFKCSDVEAVPEVHNIFSGNSYQIFARINSAAGKHSEGNSVIGNSIAGRNAAGNSVAGSSAEGRDAENRRAMVYAGVEALENMPEGPFYAIPETAPESVLITGIFKGKDLSWSIPVAAVSGQDGLTGFIPKLWAREKIRELEGGFAQINGSLQAERKTGQTDDLIISISKKYGIISSITSFVSVEERSDEEKTKGETILKKIPTLVTYGWHGFGAQGAVPGQPFTINSAMPIMSAVPKMRTGVYKSISSRNLFEDRFLERSVIHESNYDIPASSTKKFTLRERKTTTHHIMNSKARKVPDIISLDNITEIKAEILLEMLSSQKPAGGFELGDKLADLLKIDIADLKAAASAMATKGMGAGPMSTGTTDTIALDPSGVKDSNINRKNLSLGANSMPDDRFTLIITALFIRILEEFFKDTIDSWEMVVEKSRKWLEEKNINLKPEIKSKPLKDFISDYILKINIFKNPK